MLLLLRKGGEQSSPNLSERLLALRNLQMENETGFVVDGDASPPKISPLPYTDLGAECE
jgi:hypothetical protein